jgi:hypothetical protein
MKNALAAAVLLSVVSVATHAQGHLSKEEALRLCFPEPATIEPRTQFLTDEQVREIEQRARAMVPSKLLTYYIGVDSAGIQGYAFIETVTVRTMPQTLLVSIGPDGQTRFVELLAFHEPADYRAPRQWLDQLQNRQLDEDLWLKRGIQNIAGATITAHTTIAVIRRVLATYAVTVRGTQ